MRAILSFLMLGGALFASAGPAHGESAPARPVAFARCAACHSTEPGKTSFGPNLATVAGRKAGTLPGYNYSAALKSSGLVWNAATLDRWLTSPQRTVPGTRMPFPGIADKATRQQIIAYLLALK